jgi:hypothetical protein
MATTYRKDQPTLQDLIMGAAQQSPDAPQASQASGQDGSSQADQSLLAFLTQPENQGPAPQVDELSTWDKIRMTIGDSLGAAFQAYGATLAGGSPGEFHGSYEKFVARQDREKADLAEWQRKTAEAQREAKLRGLTYLDTQKTRKQMAEDARIGRQQLQDDAQAARKAIADQASEERRFKLKQDQDQFDANKKAAIEMENLRFQHDQAVAGHRRSIDEGDKAAERDDKKLDVLMANIGEFIDSAEVMLNGGDPANGVPALNAAQMDIRVRRMVEQARLGPEAKKVLETYYQKEVAPTLRKHVLNAQNNEAMAAPTSNALTAQPSTLGSGSGH